MESFSSLKQGVEQMAEPSIKKTITDWTGLASIQEAMHCTDSSLAMFRANTVTSMFGV